MSNNGRVLNVACARNHRELTACLFEGGLFAFWVLGVVNRQYSCQVAIEFCLHFRRLGARYQDYLVNKAAYNLGSIRTNINIIKSFGQVANFVGI